MGTTSPRFRQPAPASSIAAAGHDEPDIPDTGRPLRTKAGHKLVARRDTLDFRDQMYVPTLVEVPPARPLSAYLNAFPAPLRRQIILDQGTEGACTGFGLAAVANFLLLTRAVAPARKLASPWMLYYLAKRYDEWPGEDYEGSSARGAMKGWHKHGVCGLDRWKGLAMPGQSSGKDLWLEALDRPLGAYFRVNHRDLVAMHAAITEVGILYATANVHEGWENPKDGRIARSENILGGHAFAIVAYDESGFIVQNSWGTKWGKGGFSHLPYNDWLANGTDVWVARLGVPIAYSDPRAAAAANASAAKGSRAAAIHDIRSHIVSIGNDGALRAGGEYGTTDESLARLIDVELPAAIKTWKKPKILLYAHGGLVDEPSAIQKVAAYRGVLMKNEVYPISLIWKTDYLTTIRNIMQDALRRRRTEGVLDSAKDFMLDRLDDALEPLARAATGKAAWDEMKENARLATESADGGARKLLDRLAVLVHARKIELHVVAHSAGSILMGHLIERITGELGLTVATCTLWAPACTMAHFERHYLPALHDDRVKSLALYTLTDKAERDDHCANIYHKSLLYLVSNAFEEKARIAMFRDGFRILGMEKFVKSSSALDALFRAKKATWIRSPNGEEEGMPGGATAAHHGDFDDDRATLLGTLNRIANVRAPANALPESSTVAARRDLRVTLDGRATGI